MDWLQLLKDQYKHGVVRSSLAYVSITVGATSTTVYTPSSGKTFFLISVVASYRPVTDTILSLGEGAFTQFIPDLNVLGGTVQPNAFTLDNGLPLRQFQNPCVGQASAAAVSPNDVRVQATAFEF